MSSSALKSILSGLFISGSLLLQAAPVLKIGILTDTHVTADLKSCHLLERSLMLFKEKGANMIIHAGDIADVYNIRAYRNYRETFNKVYRNSQHPQEIFAYANHDWMGRKNESVRKVFKDVRKYLGIHHAPYAELKLAGYTFLVVPEFADMKRYKSMLDKAQAENPGKIFFVIDHVPPDNTVFATENLKKERKELLKNYPHAVVICGHKHNSPASELSIWQGDFTVVHAGCLQKWRHFLTGTPCPVLKNQLILFLEIHKDKLLFRRYDCLTGKEHNPDNVWMLPLPFDKKTAPYAPHRRSSETPVPEFSLSAAISVTPGEKFTELTFPHAQHKDGVYFYKIELLHLRGDKKITFARCDRPGNFTQPEKTQARFRINSGYFQPGKEYTVRITPVNFWNKEGKAQEKTFYFSGKKSGKICFESKNPTMDCKIFEGPTGNKQLLPDSEGFVSIQADQAVRVQFPGNIWPGKAWTPYRFTVEMDLKEFSSIPRLMELRNPVPRDAATGRILLPAGNSGVLRYVFNHSKREDDYNYQLMLLPGGAGKVRFTYIKSEILPPDPVLNRK